MTETLTRSRFVQQLQGTSIDVARAQADERLSGVNVRSADLNGDGKVEGEAEAKKLFSELDRFDRNGSSGSVALTTSRGRPTNVASKVEAVADLGNVSTLRALANTGVKGNDTIFHVGMTKGGAHERAALRRRGNRVIGAGSQNDDQIKVGDRTYDLNNDSDVNAFTRTLGLPAAQSARVARVIKNSTSYRGRDELARIAQEWSKAERGGSTASRLVLSGHSVGDGVSGRNGSLEQRDVLALAKAMPKAASQIEDLKIAGCYSGGPTEVAEWQQGFPNLRTYWAYDETAPDAYKGATGHLAAWDRQTRGASGSLDRNAVRGQRHANSVLTWSLNDGHEGGDAGPIRDARASYQRSGAQYDSYFSGDLVQTNTHQGTLRDHYNDLQALSRHPELPASERPGLNARRDQTIRLIYYKKAIAPQFQAHHSDAINKGFSALGMTPPDFSSMSRKDALAQIAAFEARLARTPNASAEAQNLLPLLTEGLRDLKSSRIPFAWIQ